VQRRAAFGGLLVLFSVACRGSERAKPAAHDGDAALPRITPRNVAPRTLAAGSEHACTVYDRTLYCWGRDVRKPDEKFFVPTRLEIASQGIVAEVALAGSLTCIRLTNGKVECFGANDFGQVADVDDKVIESAARIDIAKATRIAVSPLAGCAILEEKGRVACWGDPYIAGNKHLRVIDGIENAVDVTLIESHGCALRDDGAVLCWGDNRDGALATGNGEMHVPRAERVLGIPGVIALEPARRETHAVGVDGCIWKWGASGGGAPSKLPRCEPEKVAVDDAVEVAPGGAFTCVRRANGEVLCWGRNDRGQLGDNTATDRPTPVIVAGPTPFGNGKPTEAKWAVRSLKKTSGGDRSTFNVTYARLDKTRNVVIRLLESNRRTHDLSKAASDLAIDAFYDGVAQCSADAYLTTPGIKGTLGRRLTATGKPTRLARGTLRAEYKAFHDCVDAAASKVVLTPATAWLEVEFDCQFEE
jgi:alpha-tubulin suppressor-like RCC1 family protein